MDGLEIADVGVDVLTGKASLGDLAAKAGTTMWESSKRAPLVGSILSGFGDFASGISAHLDGCAPIARQRNRDAFFDFLGALDELAEQLATKGKGKGLGEKR